jgi:hypothetical protein
MSTIVDIDDDIRQTVALDMVDYRLTHPAAADPDTGVDPQLRHQLLGQRRPPMRVSVRAVELCDLLAASNPRAGGASARPFLRRLAARQGSRVTEFKKNIRAVFSRRIFP